jgi:tetratricopeptide (TPR) repeat protein
MLAWIISALPRTSARPLVLALAVFSFAPQPTAQAASMGETLASIFQPKGPTPDDARAALEQGDFKKAREVYSTLLEEQRFNESREELLYGMGATEHALTNYDGSVKNFSEALHTPDQKLRTRAHRGLGHTLYDQGARGLEKQPKITIQRWTDSLRHLEAALELDPDNKELRENRDHVAKTLDELRKVIEEQEKQQQGQEGEGEPDGQGKEGSDPNGEGQSKESEGKGEKKEADDGIGGKDAKELPEGRLQAAGGDKEGEKEGQQGKDGQKPGEGEGGDEKKQTAKAKDSGDQRNPRTGYTPGEAEGIIRQYMDEIAAPLTNRYHTPPANKKDW